MPGNGHAGFGERPGESQQFSRTEGSGPAPKSGAFAPYVDTLLRPAFNLLQGAEETGVKEYNLAFVYASFAERWGLPRSGAVTGVGRDGSDSGPRRLRVHDVRVLLSRLR